MATKSRFYAPLAEWLSEQGIATLTFDYRGYGVSGDGQLRQVTADVVRWAQDAANVLDWVSAQAKTPVTWIGHSLGGQVLPFSAFSDLEQAITIAAGSGYWRTNPGALKFIAPVLWKALAPIAIKFTGYYPGSALRVLGDLPPNMMRQWSRWCMHPDYLLGELPELRTRFAAVHIPLVSLSFTDDELLSGTSITALHSAYPETNRQMLRFTPAELAVQRIGHFGFFRADRKQLWEQVLTPLLS